MAKYSQDFKHKVVQAYLTGIGGYNTISHHFSVTHSLIEKWVEQLDSSHFLLLFIIPKLKPESVVLTHQYSLALVLDFCHGDFQY